MFQPHSARKGIRRATAAVAMGTVVLVMTSGVAAADTSQATAQAAQLDLLGEPAVDTGTVTATNDGTGEDVTGDNSPGITLLGTQDLLAAGVLAQDATAEDDGSSAACAGAVGAGGLIAIGPNRDCTDTIGTTDGVVIDLNDLDFSELDLGNLLGGDLLGGNLLGGGVLDPDGLLDLGAITADAIYAECVADSDGTASGTSTLVNANLGGLLGDDLLPTNPSENLEVDLDLAVDLDPLVRLVLNEQSTTGSGQISVTALHLTVLGEVAEDPLLDLRIGTVTCGPNAEVPPIPAIPSEGMPIAAGGFALAIFGGVAWLVVRNRRSSDGLSVG